MPCNNFISFKTTFSSIQRNKPRKRKPRVGHRRNSAPKIFNSKHNVVPKSRIGISKALEKYTSLAQDMSNFYANISLTRERFLATEFEETETAGNY